MAAETCFLLVLNFKASHDHLLAREGDPGGGGGLVSRSLSYLATLLSRSPQTSGAFPCLATTLWFSL